jgi:hypothetical protein
MRPPKLPNPFNVTAVKLDIVIAHTSEVLYLLECEIV